MTSAEMYENETKTGHPFIVFIIFGNSFRGVNFVVCKLRNNGVLLEKSKSGQRQSKAFLRPFSEVAWQQYILKLIQEITEFVKSKWHQLHRYRVMQ